jgi:diguanylate cyclase (GGDEF)-like protein/PAS domain S-box-containing protein
VLWSAGLVLVGIAILSAAGIYVVQADMRAAAISAQGALVQNTARDIDEKVMTRSDAISLAASRLNAYLIDQPEALHEYFEQRPIFRSLFDVLMVSDAQGRVVSDWPSKPGRTGISLADRHYFKQVMGGAEAVISEPIENKTTGEPTIIFSAPIRSNEGRIMGVLHGSLVLTRHNFLGVLRESKVGRDGYFYIASKGPRPVLVVHPELKRMLTAVPSKEQSKPIHEALAGFEGTLEGTNSRHLHALYTFKALKSVPWILCAVYPTAEAFATIDTRVRELIAAGCVFAIIGGLTIGVVVRRQLKPLVDLKDELVSAANGKDRDVQIHQGPRDLRELTEAYNALRQHKQNAEEAQQNVQDRLRSVLQHAADAYVSIDMNGGITEWNRQAEDTFGWPRAQVLGMRMSEVLIPEEARAAHERGFQRFLSSGAGPVIGQRIEVMALHRTGRRIPVELSVSAVKEGGVWTANAFLRDISDRKAAEEKLAASERHLRDIMNNVPAQISVVDKAGHFVSVNSLRAKTLGVPAKAMEGVSFSEFLEASEHAQVQPWVARVLNGESVSFESTKHRRDVRHYLHYFIPDRDADTQVCGFYEMTLDITERKEAEQKLATQQAQLRTITDNLPVLIAYIDKNLRYRFCNATYEAWFQTPLENIVNRPVDELRADAERMTHLKTALAGERAEFTKVLDLPGGSRHIRVIYIPDIDPSGEVLGAHGLTFDVTESKQYEQQLLQMARHDSLTGLPNRRQFEDRLVEAMARARRSKRPMALLYLDLDKFKQINDGRGHGIGDELLKGFALRLLESVRTTDTVCRLGGDEFTVILEGLNHAEEAAMVARKIERSMDDSFAVSDGSVDATTSVGVAVFEGGEGSLQELVAKADEALYRAKRAGRATFHITTF